MSAEFFHQDHGGQDKMIIILDQIVQYFYKDS